MRNPFVMDSHENEAIVPFLGGTGPETVTFAAASFRSRLHIVARFCVAFGKSIFGFQEKVLLCTVAKATDIIIAQPRLRILVKFVQGWQSLHCVYRALHPCSKALMVPSCEAALVYNGLPEPSISRALSLTLFC